MCPRKLNYPSTMEYLLLAKNGKKKRRVPSEHM
jgi:hypothetical protein